MGSYFAFKPRVPVAMRRRQAASKLATMRKKDTTVSPVIIEGRTIAASFWGKSWCANLEHYSDYASRLPRGRSYVRNGSVVDLQITEGKVSAKVVGSTVYSIEIEIAPVGEKRWRSICRDCAGTIDSVVELLRGHIDKGVMDRVCRQVDGLFPTPQEIKLSCTCPDWADMCKHVAAALYGVGARLDRQPELLFALRAVDARDMIATAGAHLAAPAPTAVGGKVLGDQDMSALFGLDMAEGAGPSPVAAAEPTHRPGERPTKQMRATAAAPERRNARQERAAVAPAAGSGQGKSAAIAKGVGRRTSATPAPPPQQHQQTVQSRRTGTASEAPTRRTKGAVTPQARRASTLSHARLEALIEEATVDAYGESEQAVGFYEMIRERLALPFKTKVLGLEADIIAIEMGDDDRLRAVCTTGRKRQRISLADIALPSKRPAGAEWIAAYRHWCRHGDGGSD